MIGEELNIGDTILARYDYYGYILIGIITDFGRKRHIPDSFKNSRRPIKVDKLCVIYLSDKLSRPISSLVPEKSVIEDDLHKVVFDREPYGFIVSYESIRKINPEDIMSEIFLELL